MNELTRIGMDEEEDGHYEEINHDQPTPVLKELYPGIPTGFDIRNGILRHPFGLILFKPEDLHPDFHRLDESTGGDEERIEAAKNALQTATTAVREHNKQAISAEKMLKHREELKASELPFMQEQIAESQRELANAEAEQSSLTKEFLKACSAAKIPCVTPTEEAFDAAVRSVACKPTPTVDVPKRQYGSFLLTLGGWLLTLLFGMPVGIAFAVTLHAVRVSELRAHFLTPVTCCFVLGGIILLSILGMFWEKIAYHFAAKKRFVEIVPLIIIATLLLGCTMSAETYAVWEYNSAREVVMRLANPNIFVVPIWAYAFIGLLGAFSVAYKYFVMSWKTKETLEIAEAEKLIKSHQKENEVLVFEYVQKRKAARDATTILEQIIQLKYNRMAELRQNLQAGYDQIKRSTATELGPDEAQLLMSSHSTAKEAVQSAYTSVEV